MVGKVSLTKNSQTFIGRGYKISFKILLLFVFLVLSMACLSDGGGPSTTMLPPDTTVPATTPSTQITSPKPEKPFEISLAFLIEENGTYLGEFTENFTLRVEPEDAEVYLNGSELNTTNGSIILSVKKGGDYEITIKNDGSEKVYHVFIGHGEVRAQEISIDYIPYVRLFFEDGAPAINRTMKIYIETSIAGRLLRRGPYEEVSDEKSLVPYWCGASTETARVRYIDSVTGKVLLTCYMDYDTSLG